MKQKERVEGYWRKILKFKSNMIKNNRAILTLECGHTVVGILYHPQWNGVALDFNSRNVFCFHCGNVYT